MIRQTVMGSIFGIMFVTLPVFSTITNSQNVQYLYKLNGEYFMKIDFYKDFAKKFFNWTTNTVRLAVTIKRKVLAIVEGLDAKKLLESLSNGKEILFSLKDGDENNPKIEIYTVKST